MVDYGLKSGSPAALDQALLFFLAVVLVLAASILLRSYLLNWLGERVVADVRQAVFERVLELDVGFFEATRTGEMISRLTSDTALLQVVGVRFLRRASGGRRRNLERGGGRPAERGGRQ